MGLFVSGIDPICITMNMQNKTSFHWVLISSAIDLI